MTALGNVCNQTLISFFMLIITVPQGASFWYWYWMMTWGTFLPIFQLHPDSIPVWKDRIANFEQNFPPQSIYSPQKVEKQKFCKFWAELSPPSMCSLQKSGKSELHIFYRIYSRHLPVLCNTATRDPDTWGNNEKNIQGKLLVQN